MKKIVLASGVMALGLLASCSNDSPEINNGIPALDGDVRYVAIRVSNNSATRAEGDETDPADTKPGSGSQSEGDKEERVIDSATLYLVDAAGKVTIARNLNVDFNGTGSETIISFPMAADAFKELTANAGDVNKKYKLYIVANAEKNGFVMNTFDVDAIVEKSEWGSGSNIGRAGYFYMANDEEISVSLPAYDATGTANGSSKATAWVLNVKATGSTVVLNRLAARFDLKVSEEPYSYQHEITHANAEFTITGAALEHINTKSYLFRHMSSDGHGPGIAFGREDHLVTPNGNWYGEECSPMKNLQYVTNISDYQNTAPVKFNYGFESSVDGSVTDGMSEAAVNALISYKNLTYVAFRSNFTYDGWTDGTKSFAVYNGEIVGTLAEMQSSDFMPSGMSDENRPYVVNTLNALRGTDGSGITVETLRANGFDYFSPDTDGKYTCYYVTPLYNDVDQNASGCCYYRVRRNRLYNMDLNSISKIGHDGEFKPDVVDVAQAKWIGLNVSVKDWTINNNTFDF